MPPRRIGRVAHLALECCCLALCGDSAAAPYFWGSTRGGSLGNYTSSPYAIPVKLESAFAWKWHHPADRFHTTVISGPLIDDKKNIYLATVDEGIWKWNERGDLLWIYHPPTAALSNAVSLYKGGLFGNSQDGYFYCVDMETGRQLWITRPVDCVGADTAYVEVHDGVVVGPATHPFDPEHFRRQGAGNTKVVGLNATTGAKIWEFAPDSPVWNLQALLAGNDSVVFQCQAGGVYRLKLHDGTLMWKAGIYSPQQWTDGGCVVGLGLVYACSNLGKEANYAGVVHAWRLEDGAYAWHQKLPTQCNSWPALGKLGGQGDSEAVVVVTGQNPDVVPVSKMEKWHPESVKLLMHSVSLAWAKVFGGSTRFWGMSSYFTAMCAFDAQTGRHLWTFTPPAYTMPSAAGDEEGYLYRKARGKRLMCLPASWGGPTISGDGTLYVGHMDGMIYAVKDRDADGRIDEATEVETFATGGAFLHPAPAFAPGMMAYANCDSMYVFRW